MSYTFVMDPIRLAIIFNLTLFGGFFIHPALWIVAAISGAVYAGNFFHRFLH